MLRSAIFDLDGLLIDSETVAYHVDRDILRYYGYNQSLSTGSMLVEIGAAGNSLDEAVYAARLFAAGFAETVGGVSTT